VIGTQTSTAAETRLAASNGERVVDHMAYTQFRNRGYQY